MADKTIPPLWVNTFDQTAATIPPGATLSHAPTGGGSAPGAGTVTSVAIASPLGTLTVSGSPITTTGTIDLDVVGAAPSGPAGGDLSGTYPNPTVANINTVALGATTATSGNLLVADGSSWVTKAMSGDATIASTGALTIAADAVTNAKLADMAAHTIKSNKTGSMANPSDNSLSDILIADSLLTTKGDFVTYSTVPLRASIGTDGQFIVADSTNAKGWAWKTLVGPVANIQTGKDRNRPAANTTNIYITTDTYQTYVSDGTKWAVAGVGPDNCVITGGGGGFSDSNYLLGPANAAGSGPSMTNPYTVLVGFYVVSLPGTGGGIIVNYGLSNITNGWLFANSTVNSNKLRIYMQGVNSNTNMEVNLTLTTGFHVVAFNYNGSSIRYCMDGGSVGNVAATGTFTAPTSSSQFFVGRFFGATGFSATWCRIGFIQGFASVLSDADMQTLSATPSTFIPGTVTTDPAFDWQARWYRSEGISGSVSQLPFYGTASSGSTAAFLIPVGSCFKVSNAS